MSGRRQMTEQEMEQVHEAVRRFYDAVVALIDGRVILAVDMTVLVAQPNGGKSAARLVFGGKEDDREMVCAMASAMHSPKGLGEPDFTEDRYQPPPPKN